MKLCTFASRVALEHPRLGAIVGERVVDLALLAEYAHRFGPQGLRGLAHAPDSMADLLRRDPDSGEQLSRLVRALHQGELGSQWDLPPLAYPLADVQLQPPVPNPPTIRDFYAFERHVQTVRARRNQPVPPEWYELPVFYYSNPLVLYGPDETIPYPAYSQALDYELELACVIGQAGVDIPEAEAEEHIAGYTILNDWSARDVQALEMRVGLGPAKGKDFATSLGPVLITPDELRSKRLPNGRLDLTMTARVNGREYSRGNARDMHWTFAQMIARASQETPLSPGDVVGSGTVGTGCILELGGEERGWLRPGDVVELEIDGIGVLRNEIGPALERADWQFE
ncbi:MAG: fumarylacetoacetate hydrolase family protein [Chloroflexi bacterium]|nr:fumarylacetoacetate hydrolase family protein [Chloroflexota bacterium]